MLGIIIFGTKGITYSKGDGEFHCPQCDDRHPYKIKRVRRFFTLYFIPIIPMDQLAEYVECSTCRGTFRHEVLQFDPAEQRKEIEAEFERAIKRVLALMMLADDEIQSEEVQVFEDIVSKLTGHDVTDEMVRNEIAKAQHEAMEIVEYLSGVTPFLNDEGKELIVRAAVMMAAADGEFQEEEKALLAGIGQGLEMSTAHLKGVVSEVLSDA